MKFKSKLISTAVLAAVGVAGTAQAVDLAVDGQGQVLIYPYYTVQKKGDNGYDTYFSIVNSDSVYGKAVKVRIIEGKNSKEVLDFNLYLSPNDVFTGTLTRDASGNGVLRTGDKSCTAPEITGDQPFVNYEYSGSKKDWPNDETLARAREGYIEVIQMADLSSGLLNAGSHDTYKNALHSNGTPANCGQIRSDWTANFFANNSGVRAPTGKLSGYGTIINPGEGTDITYDAVTLERFSTVANHAAPGSISPNLGNVNPAISVVIQGTDIVRTDWTGVLPGSLAVSALLMRDTIINEYAMQAQPVGLSTDWVITMPTKRDHIEQATAANRLPFTVNLGTGTTIIDTCQGVNLTAYNREEGQQTGGLIFSPPPPTQTQTICYEANVVSMKGGGLESNALGGVTTRLVLPVPFTEGWLRMEFNQAGYEYRTAPVGTTTRTGIYTGTTGAGYTATYYGLPVTGFAAMTYVNTSTTANYGGSMSHRYNRTIN